MEDVLDVYVRPYDPDYPVVCLDETSKQLVKETRIPLPVKPGYPHSQVITVIQDNLNTHVKNAVYEAFPPQEAKRLLDKLEFHYTPKHGSWLNIAEIELSVLCGQCLDQRIPDQESLKQVLAAWEAERNAKGTKVNWRFTTQDARIKLKRLYPSLED